MILPVSYGTEKISRQFVNKNNGISRVSFSHKIDSGDDFLFEDDYCKDDIDFLPYSSTDLHLLGVLAGKDYNVRFIQNNPKNKKNIEIRGYYNHKRLDIDANYKDDKHHYFKGSFDGKDFEIKHRIGGIFVKDSLKGKIGGKSFSVKFPSASATDENKDLILLLLHLSGFTTSLDGCNFSVTEPSDFSYSYFSGRYNNIPRGGTLLDDIWKDPVPGPICV